MRRLLPFLCACHGLYSSSDDWTAPPPPVAEDDLLVGHEDTPLDLAPIFANDAVDAELRYYSLTLVTPPAHGTAHLAVNAQAASRYEPYPGYHGHDSFTYALTSIAGGGTSTATVDVDVVSDGIPYEQAVIVDDTPIHSLASGDFDRDGRADLVAIDGTGVRVFLNRSTPGHFAFDTHVFSAGHAPTALALADFDDDGILDIAVASQADGVVVLRNRTVGVIAFDAPVIVPAGYATAVAAADIDQDGHPDLLSLDGEGNTLDVRLNQSVHGSLAFGARTSFAVGKDPRAIAAVDVDHQGGIDVIVLAHADALLSIFTNATSLGAAVPAFAARADRATGKDPRELVIANRGSADPDIALVDYGGELWLYPNVSGTYADASITPLPYGYATSVSTIGSDLVIGYAGYYSDGIVQQQMASGLVDLTIGIADSATPTGPQLPDGFLQIDLDGVSPLELVVASDEGFTASGATGLVVLYGD